MQHPEDRYMMVKVGQTILVLLGVMFVLIYLANQIA